MAQVEVQETATKENSVSLVVMGGSTASRGPCQDKVQETATKPKEVKKRRGIHTFFQKMSKMINFKVNILYVFDSAYVCNCERISSK